MPWAGGKGRGGPEWSGRSGPDETVRAEWSGRVEGRGLDGAVGVVVMARAGVGGVSVGSWVVWRFFLLLWGVR
ncbi:hypothetical protein GCM10010428_42450 [Actinosynnema pretiosum subsp. pretiosum]